MVLVCAVQFLNKQWAATVTICQHLPAYQIRIYSFSLSSNIYAYMMSVFYCMQQ